jgi:tRNA1(Val) A37 N6-methylase TrmN6
MAAEGPPDADLTDDAFLGGRLRVLQPARGFRSGIDAVLLAAAAPAAAGERVLDVGTGAGVAALCLARRVEGVAVTGIEIQPDLCALARANAERNGLTDTVAIVEADVLAPTRALGQAGVTRGGFDHVIANPPFYQEGRARPAGDPGKARASMLGPEDLERWVRFMVSMARPGGTVTLVHRTDALPRLLALLERRAGAVTVLPLHPRAGERSGRVLVTGRTGSRAPFALLPGLVLHGDGDAFTPEADAILRHGAALVLGC